MVLHYKFHSPQMKQILLDTKGTEEGGKEYEGVGSNTSAGITTGRPLVRKKYNNSVVSLSFYNPDTSALLINR